MELTYVRERRFKLERVVIPAKNVVTRMLQQVFPWLRKERLVFTEAGEDDYDKAEYAEVVFISKETMRL